jgi:hypothetical protein
VTTSKKAKERKLKSRRQKEQEQQRQAAIRAAMLFVRTFPQWLRGPLP